MKTALILDYSKWRSGSDGQYKVGKGCTHLLNEDGFMCCLGQFSKQLLPEISDEDLYMVGDPEQTLRIIPILQDRDFKYNLPVTYKAIDINDYCDTTPLQKIELLKQLFSQHDCEIEVINAPCQNNQ